VKLAVIGVICLNQTKCHLKKSDKKSGKMNFDAATMQETSKDIDYQPGIKMSWPIRFGKEEALNY